MIINLEIIWNVIIPWNFGFWDLVFENQNSKIDPHPLGIDSKILEIF